MGLQALSRKTRDFITSDCKGDESPTTFQIKSLTHLQYSFVQDILLGAQEMVEDGEVPVFKVRPSDVAKYRLKVLELGLVGWKNHIDEDGEPFEFSEENKEYLPQKQIESLCAEITGEVSEEEEKNSETPS